MSSDADDPGGTIVVDDSSYLRRFMPDDAELFLRHITENKESLQLPILFPWVEGLQTPEDCRDFISNGRGFTMGLWHESKLVGVFHVPLIEGGVAEITYWLARQAQRNGFASRACSVLISSLKDMGVRMVEGWVPTKNERSMNLLLGAGFEPQEPFVRMTRQL